MLGDGLAVQGDGKHGIIELVFVVSVMLLCMYESAGSYTNFIITGHDCCDSSINTYLELLTLGLNHHVGDCNSSPSKPVSTLGGKLVNPPLQLINPPTKQVNPPP